MAEQKPKDAIPNNGFVMEMPGLTSPHIEKISGLSMETGTLEQGDGGTNLTYYFSDGVLKFGEPNFSRTRDGSPDDAAFQKFFEEMVKSGKKYNGTIIQYRFGEIVLKIQFQGLLCHKFELSDLELLSTSKSEQKYATKVDFMKILYNAAARQ